MNLGVFPEPLFKHDIPYLKRIFITSTTMMPVMNIRGRKMIKTNKPICVILGGSFNPPTKAHRILMESAMKYLQADIGLYVPSSDFYVSRKVNRQTCSKLLPEQTRLSLLKAMCSHTDRISVDTCEYGDTSKGRTLQTLEEIQEKYPNHDIWFMIGCDKINIFHKWETNKTILKKFNLLWVGRNNLDTEAAIDKSPPALPIQGPPADYAGTDSCLWNQFFCFLGKTVERAFK